MDGLDIIMTSPDNSSESTTSWPDGLPKDRYDAPTALRMDDRENLIIDRAFRDKSIRKRLNDPKPLVFIWLANFVSHTVGTNNTSTIEVDAPGGPYLFTAKTGEYEECDAVVVMLPGAFLPTDASPVFARLKGTSRHEDGEIGYQVTNTLDPSGVYCNGLIRHLDLFPELTEIIDAFTVKFGGDQILAIDYFNMCFDAEKVLCAKRWKHKQTPTSLGPAPGFYRKSHIKRLRECPNFFTKPKYHHLEYQETKKMDGASMAIYFIRKDSPFYFTLNPLPENHGKHMLMSNGRFGVCSMNFDLPEREDCPYWKVALAQNLHEIMNKDQQDLVLQGELVGDKINHNLHNFDPGHHEFFAFDLWEPFDEGNWLPPRQTAKWCEDRKVQHVPILGYHKLRKIAEMSEDLQKRADRSEGEGLVFKCSEEPERRFKVHNRKYYETHSFI